MGINLQNERLWNDDLIDLLKEELKKEFPKICISKGKILRDIILQKVLQKNKNNEFELQFGFFEQDIIIHNEEDVLDIKALTNIKSIKIHNNNSSQKNTLIIPSIIIELKYDGVNTHGIITYSNIASDIKSIFPKCKYIFALRYNSGSGDNKLLRNGKNFDNIMYFEDNDNKGKKYEKGQFKRELEEFPKLRDKWNSLISFIKLAIKSESNSFLK